MSEQRPRIVEITLTTYGAKLIIPAEDGDYPLPGGYEEQLPIGLNVGRHEWCSDEGEWRYVRVSSHNSALFCTKCGSRTTELPFMRTYRELKAYFDTALSPEGALGRRGR